MSNYFEEKRYEALKGVVERDAKAWEDEAKTYLSNLVEYGCVGGSCTDLVGYAQTHAFFDEHYDAIETIRQEWEEDTGIPIKIEGDLKNFFAWFAYEYVARQLLDEMEEE